MKKARIYLPIFLMGLFFVWISGCTETPVETCAQDEICTGKSVTACCTDTKCYYQYNGVEYGDDAASLAQLAAALGCAQASSSTYESEIEDLVLRLEALSEIAQSNQQAIK